MGVVGWGGVRFELRTQFFWFVFEMLLLLGMFLSIRMKAFFFKKHDFCSYLCLSSPHTHARFLCKCLLSLSFVEVQSDVSTFTKSVACLFSKEGCVGSS